MTRIYHCVPCVTAYLACASDVKKQTKKGPRNQFKSGANTSLLLSEAEVTQGGREEKQTQEWCGPLNRISVPVENDMPAHAPGVPACWPMRGSPPSIPSWTGVVSCSAVMTMVFSSTSSQVGLEKADRGRVILCISRSYTRCSCCFFRSRPLNRNTQQKFMMLSQIWCLLWPQNKHILYWCSKLVGEQLEMHLQSCIYSNIIIWSRVFDHNMVNVTPIISVILTPFWSPPPPEVNIGLFVSSETPASYGWKLC